VCENAVAKLPRLPYRPRQVRHHHTQAAFRMRLKDRQTATRQKGES
jgi:hypothetical protein